MSAPQTVNTVKKLILCILDGAENQTVETLFTAFSLSLVVNAGVIQQPIWRALIQRTGLWHTVGLCRNTIWLNYTVTPQPGGVANMRDTSNWEQTLEDRCYPDNITLALLVALAKHPPEALQALAMDANWARFEADIPALPDFSTFACEVLYEWQHSSNSQITGHLAKVLSGEWPSCGLDHLRHQHWMSGKLSNANLPSRRFSTAEISEEEQVADSLCVEAFNTLRVTMRRCATANRISLASHIRNACSTLSPSAKLIAEWFIAKLEKRDIAVSTAAQYLHQLGVPFFEVFAREFEQLGTNVSTTQKRRINNDLKARYESSRTPQSAQLGIERAHQVIQDIYHFQILTGGRGATFVNANLVVEKVHCKLLKARPVHIPPTTWWSWLTLLQNHGLRESELFQVRRTDASFKANGTVVLHIHRDIKNRSSNRLIIEADETLRFYLAFHRWLMNSTAALLMPVIQTNDKNLVSTEVNQAIRRNSDLLDDDLVAHSYRHTVPSKKFHEALLAESSFSGKTLDQKLDDIAEVLGHATIARTLRHYIHTASESIAYRLNNMLPILSHATMSELLSQRYKCHEKNQERQYQKAKLIQALVNNQPVNIVKTHAGRPLTATPPIKNITRLINLLISQTPQKKPKLPHWVEVDRQSQRLLNNVASNYPNLFKKDQQFKLPQPRSPVEAALLESCLLIGLQSLDSRRLTVQQLSEAALRYNTTITPNGFECPSPSHLRSIIRMFQELGIKPVSLSMALKPQIEAETTAREWRKSFSRLSSKTSTISNREKCVALVHLMNGERSHSTVRPLLIMLLVAITS